MYNHREYNIITNLYHGSTGPSSSSVPAKQKLYPAHMNREYNIICNRFHDNHNKKVAIERQGELERAQNKKNDIYKYNPVLATYTSKEREERMKLNTQIQDDLIVKNKLDKMPLHHHMRDGAAVDVVTNKVINRDLYKLRKQNEQRSKLHWKVGPMVHDSVREYGYDAQGVNSVRALNRQRPRLRYAAHRNIISNTRHGI